MGLHKDEDKNIKMFFRKTKDSKPDYSNFIGSSEYWESRYQKGRNSGAGSYGRLAEFKAEVLNDFVDRHGIQSVLELGSGDGNQLKLANYPQYIGLDVSRSAIKSCAEMFKNDATKSFFWYDPEFFFDRANTLRCDLSLSLDVIYHLVEDSVFDQYMEQLFSLSSKYIIIYASNHNKNKASAIHVKHREFTKWVDRNAQEWKLIKKIDNKYPLDPSSPEDTSFSDFYIYQKDF